MFHVYGFLHTYRTTIIIIILDSQTDDLETKILPYYGMLDSRTLSSLSNVAPFFAKLIASLTVMRAISLSAEDDSFNDLPNSSNFKFLQFLLTNVL